MKVASYEKVFEKWLSFRDAVKGHLSGYRTKLSLREKDAILQYTPQQLQIPTGADITKYNVLQWATKGKMQVDLLEYFSLLSNKSPSYGPCQLFMQEIRDVFPDTSNDTANKKDDKQDEKKRERRYNKDDKKGKTKDRQDREQQDTK